MLCATADGTALGNDHSESVPSSAERGNGYHHLLLIAVWPGSISFHGRQLSLWQHHAGPDQVAAALEKIISHIGNPKKFKKASPLLRQLLSQGSVHKAHASLLFEVPP